MAAAARGLIRAAGALLGALALALLTFGLAGWAGSAIPRNRDWQGPLPGEPGAVEILIESNGVHTAIVMPLVTPDKDWRRSFPASDITRSDAPYTHLALSWGERDVFLNTPTWWDLRPMTVLRIVGIGGHGLIHAAHYVRPAPADHLRPLRLRREEYRRLVAAIERTLPPTRLRHAGYGAQDVFYEAPGRYTAANTCNQWTSDRLAEAGVRIGWWTPFAGGVMKWLPKARGIAQSATGTGTDYAIVAQRGRAGGSVRIGDAS